MNYVLTKGEIFERVKAPGDSITSPHSILGAGGVSATWKRLRGIANPFFSKGEFEEATDKVIQHVIKSVAEYDGKRTDLFQLINRMIVESHLLVILGLDADEVPANGKEIPVRDFMKSDVMEEKCMADIIDASLNVKMAEPKFTSVTFAPMMTWLTERLSLDASELGGIEKILHTACKNGEISTMERLHNIIMYMIALAPSPATFWTILHVYKNPEYLEKIREESDESLYNMLSMCVKETLRMYAPVPIMVTRYCRFSGSKDRLLAGHDEMVLEEGDRILIPTIILHNSPYLWNEPNKYNPYRFEAPAERSISLKKEDLQTLMRGSGVQARPDSVKDTKKRNKARYFPFGQGKHTCLGQPYASWITMTVCSVIFNHFDMDIEDCENLLGKECSYERIKDHVYTFPKAPFKAKITNLAKEDDDSMLGKDIDVRKTASRTSMSEMASRDSQLTHDLSENLNRYSTFFQEVPDFDDEDSDDEEWDGHLHQHSNISARTNLISAGSRRSVFVNGFSALAGVEEGDEED